MHAANFLASWDTTILMLPFLGLLAFWMFGLDERVAAPRERSTRRRFCQTDFHGRSQFCDPDGRTAKTRHPITPPPPYRSRPVEIPLSESPARHNLISRKLLDI